MSDGCTSRASGACNAPTCFTPALSLLVQQPPTRLHDGGISGCISAARPKPQGAWFALSPALLPQPSVALTPARLEPSLALTPALLPQPSAALTPAPPEHSLALTPALSPALSCSYPSPAKGSTCLNCSDCCSSSALLGDKCSSAAVAQGAAHLRLLIHYPTLRGPHLL